MAGKDDYDSTASSVPVANYSGNLEFKGKARIAYLSEALNSEGLDPEIKASMQQNIDKLRAEGHVVEEAHFPYLDYVVPTYYILTTAEASSNLARYDGVHYGYRSDKAVDLETNL